ncbi:MAG: hypothetical protein M3O20_11465, partial [Acidobacteriota bacterium]|nr:hypothetical protein [Acidobacteriota bacterium]
MRTTLLRHRRAASAAFHALAAGAALASAFLLRFEFMLDARYGRMLLVALPVAIAVKLAVFRGYALRDLPWRYLGLEGVTRMVAANATASFAAAVLLRWQWGSAFPRSIYVLDFLLCLAFMTGARLLVRLHFEPSRGVGSRRILIYGAGRAGVTLLSEIREHPELGYQVAGFLDDDPLKRDLRLRGVRVWGGRAMLAEAVRRERIG